MHPNGPANILFRGIPRHANHRSARFLTSLGIHMGAVVLVLIGIGVSGFAKGAGAAATS